MKQAFNFEVIANASDASGGSPADTLLLPVELVERARLSVNASIIEPNGAIDGVLSTGQPFDIQIQVSNSGIAQTTDNNTVRLTLPTGYTPQTIPIATGAIQNLTFTAPVSASALNKITARLVTPANDENTGTCCDYRHRSARNSRANRCESGFATLAERPDGFLHEYAESTGNAFFG